jgi:hypothetical protein
MKRIVLTILLIALIGLAGFIGNANAQDWYMPDKSTVSWDAVDAYKNGTAIPSGDVVSYEVFIRPRDTEPTENNAVKLGTTTTTDYTISFQNEGFWFAGVRAVRFDGNGTRLSESVIAWSDDSNSVKDTTFGFKFFYPPAMPGGLGRQ